MAACHSTFLLVMYVTCLGLDPNLVRRELGCPKPTLVAAELFLPLLKPVAPVNPHYPSAMVKWGQNLPTSTQSPSPKPQKSPSSSRKNLSLIQKLFNALRQRQGLFILGLGSIIITALSVFILLKLFDHDDLEAKELEDLETAATSQTSSLYRADSDNPALKAKNIPVVNTNLIPKNPEYNSRNPSHISEVSSETLEPLESHPTTEHLVVSKTPDHLVTGDTLYPSPVSRVEELIHDLQNPNPNKRRAAIWALGQQGDSRAVQPLVDLLIDSDSKQQSLILAALSEIGLRTLKPMNRALALSLQNENAEVRKNAIRDLTRIYELVVQVSHLLDRAVDDPDADIREIAQWALNQIHRHRPSSRDSWPR